MSHCTVLDLCHTLTVIAAVVMIQCDVITSQNGVFFAPFIFFIDFENFAICWLEKIQQKSKGKFLKSKLIFFYEIYF